MPDIKTKNSPLAYIEISKKNLIHNFRALERIAGKTKIVAAIKGNAYGHGEREIAKILEPYADSFQVNSLEELKLLRKTSRKKVFLLGYVEKKDLWEAMKLGCVLSVFSVEQMSKISALAKSFNKIQEVHAPVDALLGREGFLNGELAGFLKEVKKCRKVKLTGLYAHFANVEDSRNFVHAEKQIKKYKEALKLAEKFGFKNLETHISATSGLLVFEANKNINTFVRLGIGLYGLWPSEHIRNLSLSLGKQGKSKLELRPVLQLKTKIAQIKILPKGHNIGYGLSYFTKRSMKIAVIPVGYADGIDRGLSNLGRSFNRRHSLQNLGPGGDEYVCGGCASFEKCKS